MEPAPPGTVDHPVALAVGAGAVSGFGLAAFAGTGSAGAPQLLYHLVIQLYI